jgi:hypothetical protein
MATDDCGVIKIELNPALNAPCCRCDLKGDYLIYAPDPEFVGVLCGSCFVAFIAKLLRQRILTHAQLEAAEERFLRSLPQEEQIRRRALLAELGLLKVDGEA